MRGMPSVIELPARAAVPGALVQLADERSDSCVTIAPQRGAIVTSFRVAGRELLYLDEATLSDANKNVRGGIPVLFPSPGKLDADSWRIAGRQGAMKQHGFARNLVWTTSALQAKDTAEVTLSLASNAVTLAQYPWEFQADLTFTLRAASLRIALRVQNRSASALPFAFGLHPYFHVVDKARARIDTHATRVFDNVTKQVQAFHGFDLTADEVDLHLLDHGSSHSTLQLADGASVQVRASQDLSWWVIWTLAGKDYVCLEPWTAPGNALNSAERLLWIEPGAAHDSWVEIAFTPKP
jgi:galactose mutarotase-like enzyme